MVSRCPAPSRASKLSLPRVASVGLVAAIASPLAVAAPSQASPGTGPLPSSPLRPLPATPLDANPVRTLPVPASPVTTPMPATPLPATPGSTVTRHVTEAANVRSGAGTQFAVVGSLAAGARVSGTMTSNGWLDMGNGRFVAGGLLSTTPPGGGAPAPAPPSTGTVTRTVAVGANVRSGPGTQHPVVGGLSAGTVVSGTMTGNGWLDMGSGRFVYGGLLADGGTAPPPPPAPAPTPPPSEVLTRTVASPANVRSGPGTEHTVVGSLSAGATVTGTMTSNGWLDMGSTRFVWGGLLSTTPPGGNPTPPPAPAPPPGTVSGTQVLNEVSRYAGIMYLWGGADPATGFDCSGLTWYTFRQLGLTLPRTSAQQRNAVPHVPAADRRPGDLIFFGTPAYHVGIYAGNNMLWDAPRAGMPVQLRQIWDTGDITYGRHPGVGS